MRRARRSLVKNPGRLLAWAIILTLGGAGLGAAQQKGPGQGAPLPPGHPPVGGAPVIPPPPSIGGEQDLVWTVPSGWTKETPSSAMRRAQYRITGPGGPAECVVFYFGPGQGGSADANAARWAGQFRGASGAPVGDMKKSRIKVGDVPVLMVEVTGTYVGGMGGSPGGPDRPNQMLLGAIAETSDANWFFRALGPRATIEAQRKAFEGMIRSIRLGKAT